MPILVKEEKRTIHQLGLQGAIVESFSGEKRGREGGTEGGNVT